MPTFLFKTEPGDYSFDDLVREKRCVWSGVSNPVALRNLRSVAKGDEIFIYHTGDDKAIVGLARAVTAPYEDPKRPGTNDAGEPKMAVVDIAPVRKAAEFVSLAAVKADKRFAAFPLVTQGRLSVMPVPADIDRALRRMAGL